MVSGGRLIGVEKDTEISRLSSKYTCHNRPISPYVDSTSGVDVFLASQCICAIYVRKKQVVESRLRLAPYNMEKKKLKHGTTEYWMDWYWNRGGREKVQARRYIREYERERNK